MTLLKYLTDHVNNDTEFKCLNLGCGNRPLLSPSSLFKSKINILNVDKMNPLGDLDALKFDYFKCDVFKFLESYVHTFDLIWADRFLEHISFNDIPYLIHLINGICIDKFIFTVPDFTQVSNAFNDIKPFTDPDWYIKTLKSTMEINSDPSAPHLSTWNRDIGTKLIEQEGYFKVSKIENVTIDNKSWYIRFHCTKI